MISRLYPVIDRLLGLGVEPRQLTAAQMSLRAFVVFIASLLMLRIAHKRFFAERNPLDVLLALIIASTLSRAINGNAAFFPTLAAGFGLVLLHRALTFIATRPAYGRTGEGPPRAPHRARNGEFGHPAPPQPEAVSSK